MLGRATADLDAAVAEGMERQFLAVSEVGLQELLEGGFGEFGLQGDEALLAGVVDHESSVVGLQGADFCEEVGVAGEVDLVELVLIDEVDGYFLEVLIGSPVLL